MSLPGSYFDDMYDRSPDPWGFTDRWYEQRKRAVTLALLPEPRYPTAYEPGCSIGVLTEALAARCDSLLATDVSGSAVEAAAHRCAGLAGVVLRRATLPAAWPAGTFDLVVLSELGYYFDADDLDEVARSATRGGRTVLAVHWRHPVDDYPQGGDEVHEHLRSAADDAGLRSLGRYEDADLLADVWSADPRSVAARQGLA